MIASDLSKVKGLSDMMELAPEELTKSLAFYFQQIGKNDIELIRANVDAGLNLKSKNALRAVKYIASDAKHAGDNPGKIFVNFYSKWKALDIFEKGGQIRPKKSGGLFIPIGEGRGPTGKRRFTDEQIRAKIAAGEFKIIPTPNGPIIVQQVGGLTKTGMVRKNSRMKLIALIRKAVAQKKRTSIGQVIANQNTYHVEMVEKAVEAAMQAVCDRDEKGH